MKKQISIGLSVMIMASAAFAAGGGAKPGVAPKAVESKEGKEVKESQEEQRNAMQKRLAELNSVEMQNRVQIVARKAGAEPSALLSAVKQRFAVSSFAEDGETAKKQLIKVDALELFKAMEKKMEKSKVATEEDAVAVRLIAELATTSSGALPGETLEVSQARTRLFKKFVYDTVDAMTNPESTSEDMASYKKLGDKYFEARKNNSSKESELIYATSIDKDAQERQFRCKSRFL